MVGIGYEHIYNCIQWVWMCQFHNISFGQVNVDTIQQWEGQHKELIVKVVVRVRYVDILLY